MRSQAGGTPLGSPWRSRRSSVFVSAHAQMSWRPGAPGGGDRDVCAEELGIHQLHRTVTSPLGGTKVLQDDDVNDTTKMLLGSLGLLGTVITEYLIVVGAPIRTRTLRLRGRGSW